MPLLIIIGLLVVVKIASKPKKKKKIPPLPVYDPVKVQKEYDRQRREQDRIADRERRIAEQQRKRKEQEQKQLAAATTSRNKADAYMTLVEEYATYIEQLEQEKDDSNISLTRINQIDKEILKAKEKIIKLGADADKAYYQAQAYFTNKPG